MILAQVSRKEVIERMRTKDGARRTKLSYAIHLTSTLDDNGRFRIKISTLDMAIDNPNTHWIRKRLLVMEGPGNDPKYPR